MRHAVDTHSLLWHLTGDPRLGDSAKAILSDPNSDLILPATVLAEACWIVGRGRVPLTIAELIEAVDNDPRITFIPLSREVIVKSTELATIAEMHDREIVATVLLLIEGGEEVILLTYDGNITASGLVPIIW